MSAVPLSISADAPTLMLDTANRLLALCREAIEARDVFHIALSGGNTPRALFRLMASPLFVDRFDWSRMHLWWSDERYVALDSVDLNFNMADEALIRHVGIPGDNVHRVPVEQPAAEAAAAYEAAIVQRIPGNGVPVFDAILLGLGDDGHTASLFPGTVSGLPVTRLVLAHFVPKVNMQRITFTPRLINAARHVLFLVSGRGKAAILDRVIHEPFQPDLLPAQLIAPSPGDLFWLVDRDAAGHGHGQ